MISQNHQLPRSNITDRSSASNTFIADTQNNLDISNSGTRKKKFAEIRISESNFNDIIKIVESNAAVLEKEICTICFESFKEDEECRITPCQHKFHYECIFAWLITHRNKCCPNDNYKLQD